MTTDRIKMICAEAAGIDLARCDPLTERRVTAASLHVHLVSEPHPWLRPREVEAGHDSIIADIRKLRKRIADLDDRSLWIARREAGRPEREAAAWALMDAGDNEELYQAALPRYLAACRPSKEQRVDVAAIRSLEALEVALTAAAAAAIEMAGETRPGRPRNRHADEVAEAGALAYVELTGTTPRFWNGDDSRFIQMIENLYLELGINADTRRPIERALSKLPKSE